MAFCITFLAYVSLYISRKPWSVAKAALVNCSEDVTNCTSFIRTSVRSSVEEDCVDDDDVSNGDDIDKERFSDAIDGKSEADAKRMSSVLDTSFLVAYAFFLFVW